MQFGIAIFPTHDGIDPATLAREVESRGFESLLFPEHTHIPTSRRSPYPAGGELPRQYVHTYDPFVALTAAAQATERLQASAPASAWSSSATRSPPPRRSRASTTSPAAGSCSASAPAGTARRWRTTAPTRRSGCSVLVERVKAMKEIWAKDEAEFHGEYVDFDPIWAWPKPVQQPNPPVLVGGMGPDRRGPGARDRRRVAAAERHPRQRRRVRQARRRPAVPGRRRRPRAASR